MFPRIHFSHVCEFLVIPCNCSHCEDGSFEELSLQEAQGTIALALSTWKKEFKTEYRKKWKEKSKEKERRTEKDKARNREATRNNQPLTMDGMELDDARMQTLEPCGVIHIIRCVQCS